MQKKNAAFFIITIMLAACNNNVDFNSNGWKDRSDDPLYPNSNRARMLHSLQSDIKLVGKNTGQIREMLGNPELIEKGCYYYQVEVKYSNDIDPTFTKDFVVKFNSDSLVISSEIIEQKR